METFLHREENNTAIVAARERDTVTLTLVKHHRFPSLQNLELKCDTHTHTHRLIISLSKVETERKTLRKGKILAINDHRQTACPLYLHLVTKLKIDLFNGRIILSFSSKHETTAGYQATC